MRKDTRVNLRVGLLVAAALVLLAAGILTIGQRQQLFMRHASFYSTFVDVQGLQSGAPVNLYGVTVGFVDQIYLPPDPTEGRIRVEFSVLERFADRIRLDTRASIKTVGLLGDKYLALAGGSADAPPVPPGGRVPSTDPAEMQRFIQGGEDLMENLLAISSSLKVVLRRVEAGEGLLGDLTRDPEEGRPLGEQVRDLVGRTDQLLARVESGEGLLGRLISDDAAAEQLLADVGGAAAAARTTAERLAEDLAAEESAYAALLRDPEGQRRVQAALAALQEGSEALAAVARELSSGTGVLPRLMADEDYGDDFLADLAALMDNLRAISDKLDQGTGTAGAFINDPQLYEDIENVVRGVKSSKILSWFIRNRRAKGERVEAEAEAAATAPAEGAR